MTDQQITEPSQRIPVGNLIAGIYAAKVRKSATINNLCFPDAKYQRCIVHFYRSVFSVVPRSKVKLVAKMLKAIHTQESKKASREKANAVVEELRYMKLKEEAKRLKHSSLSTIPKKGTQKQTTARWPNIFDRNDECAKEKTPERRIIVFQAFSVLNRCLYNAGKCFPITALCTVSEGFQGFLCALKSV